MLKGLRLLFQLVLVLIFLFFFGLPAFKQYLAMEVMVVAYIVPNGQDLFKVASDFASKHRKELVKTSKWDELKMKYPDIILKVVDAIMFKE